MLFSSVRFSSVAQSRPTLCVPMNRSTPGLPVHHHLPEFTQTHVHRVRDAIQPSHPGSSPSPPVPNPSQHQSLFQWLNSSHEVSTLSKIFKVNERPDSMSKKSQRKQLLELLTEAEALIFLPLDAKNRLEKILILGKTESKKRKVGSKGWDGWMASLTQWTWMWANSGRQWRTEEPGML